MTLPVHVHTVIPINRSDLSINISTAQHVHIYTCSVYFLIFGITCTVTFPLICWGMYAQIPMLINLPVYLHTSPLSNNKDLPVTTNAGVPAHRCTFSLPYLFIFILYFRLNAKIYPSTFLQRCMTLFICLSSCFSSSNHKNLPVTTCTCVPTHIYIYPSMSYLFIFILQFQ